MLNYKKPAFWIIAVAVVTCIVVAVCFLTNPKTADISLGNIHISWAKTLDLRPNDPVSRDLSTAQLDELKSRLISLKIGKEEPDFAGLTPFYSISAYSSQTGQFLLAGYNYDGKNNALMYKGKYYRINDADFSAYLSNICAGNDVTEAVMVGNAVKWFDCLHGDEMVWDGRREINLDEFPGVTFRWFSEKLEAVTEKETITLYTGMPIWSVYFCDLNGDGKPEICSSISFGSGMIDNRIIVADYANKGVYELSDRGDFDYYLTYRDGQLWVEKRASMQDAVLESGLLMLRSVVGTDGTATPMLMFGQYNSENKKSDSSEFGGDEEITSLKLILYAMGTSKEWELSKSEIEIWKTWFESLNLIPLSEKEKDRLINEMSMSEGGWSFDFIINNGAVSFSYYDRGTKWYLSSDSSDKWYNIKEPVLPDMLWDKYDSLWN